MQDVLYIMVTKWARHWDDLAYRWGNSTLYTLGAIKDGLSNGPWPSSAKTLFIKLSEANTFEKSWIGISKNFRPDANNGKPAIRFEVSDLVEVECPQQYKVYLNGWHRNKTAISGIVTEPLVPYNNDNLCPPFFKQMATCNALDFELHCFQLLRLLGIHDIHKIPQDNNRGKADGFFKFQNLSVIYDATLEANFINKKETQIENYINQLKKEKLVYNSISYTIKDSQKQVWIITRGNNVKVIKIEDHIKVKEIPYTKLVGVYNSRLEQEIGLEELWDTLKDLK